MIFLTLRDYKSKVAELESKLTEFDANKLALADRETKIKELTEKAVNPVDMTKYIAKDEYDKVIKSNEDLSNENLTLENKVKELTEKQADIDKQVSMRVQETIANVSVKPAKLAPQNETPNNKVNGCNVRDFSPNKQL